MFKRNHCLRRTLALLIGPALLLVLGCSDDGLGKRYQVSGTVSYKGQPVPKARIAFYPSQGQGGGPGASGDVVDGKFASLTTLSPGDGVLAGDYKVTVDDRAANEEEMRAEAEKLAKKHPGYNVKMLPPGSEVQAAALKKAKSSIPPKYQIPDTSDLKAKVDDSHTTFSFELKD
jgi:hypothetical protein